MKEEFNLSHNIIPSQNLGWVIQVKDVRNAMRAYEDRLRKLSVQIKDKVIGVELAIFELREILGEKLK